MITFANPAWLYGLVGLLVPIGIHLLSRKDGRTIYIGSIRHLTDSDTAQFSSIRLNEIVLLILRLILITLFVFILAGFNLDLGNRETKRWLVIEKGIEKDGKYESLIDSLGVKGFEMHWLAKGLPLVKDSSNVAAPENYYQLVNEIDRAADTAIVLSYNLSSRFKGEKISLPPSVKWLAVEPSKKEIAVEAINLPGDSVIARIASSDAESTSYAYSRISSSAFEKVAKIDSLQIHNADTIDITIFADPEFDYDRKIIQASIQAIAKALPQKFNLSVIGNASDISTKSDFVFWLSNTVCQVKNKTVIGYSVCTNPNLPLLHLKEGSIYDCRTTESFDWIISKRLNEENALEESLPLLLARIFLNDHSLYNNTNNAAADQRAFRLANVFADLKDRSNSKSTIETRAGNEPLLLILLLLILITERYIALTRRQ